MNWYRDHEDAWRQIIETVAAEERRSTQMVEKDTLQSMFLLGLSKSELPFIFKGGTSLSKAYDLIDRFSEDIDLSADRKLSEIERRRTKNTILETADHQDITDRLWQHQHSQHRYDTGTDGNRHVEGKRKQDQKPDPFQISILVPFQIIEINDDPAQQDKGEVPDDTPENIAAVV